MLVILWAGGKLRLTVTAHLSYSPQYDFIIVVLVEKFNKVIGKHARFACWCDGTMPPTSRLYSNVCYDGAFYKIQLIQLAGRVIELNYCTDWKREKDTISAN